MRQLISRFSIALLVGLGLTLSWISPVVAQTPTEASGSITIERDRLSAVIECLPEQLGSKNKDIGDRLARSLGEMGNSQIERALGANQDINLSQAEMEFERCLESKGYTPQRQLGNS